MHLPEILNSFITLTHYTFTLLHSTLLLLSAMEFNYANIKIGCFDQWGNRTSPEVGQVWKLVPGEFIKIRDGEECAMVRYNE